MIDLGTGNNNKINWAMEDKQVIKVLYLSKNKTLCTIMYTISVNCVVLF